MQETHLEDWDLLWTLEYPFEDDEIFHLDANQRINHWPGCGWLTSKVDLTDTVDSIYIPKAFRLPERKDEFLIYAKNHPQKRFLEKSITNRGVSAKSPSEIDFTNSSIFVQEMVENPLLIEDRMFDFGVYVVITSIDPLRIYMWDMDILLRVCLKTYYPFNKENLDSYVIGDHFHSGWHFNSINKFTQQKFSLKMALNAHLQERGLHVSEIWEQIEDSIISTVLNQEERLINAAKNYNSKRNFFELVRFDFMVDDLLNVHLLEVNMSPGLFPRENTKIYHESMYEQLILDTLILVGFGSNDRKL